MNIQILCVGTLKEKYLREGVAEYAKRLGSYCRLTIREISEEKLPLNASPAQIRQAMEREGERLFRELPKETALVCLCVEGRSMDSVAFAHSLERWAVEGGGAVTFVIGGSDGLSEELKRRAAARLSFSEMTFPHQLMRLVLVEQIYRGFRILKNEPYHK